MLKRIGLILITLAALCGNVYAAQKAASIEFLLSQVRTSTTSLSGGKVYAYEVGSTTQKTIWLDRNKSQLANNPYTLDSNGTAQIFGDGLYRLVIKDSFGATKYDRDGLSFVDVLSSGVERNSSDFASLNAAITEIASTETTLKITTADFPVTANVLVPSNITLEFVYPGSLDANTYTVTGLKEARPEWFGTGAAAIQAAINAADITYFKPFATYQKNSAITIPSNKTLIGDNTIIETTAAATQGLIVTGSNVTIKGIKLNGTQHATYSANERAIDAYGADSSNYITNLKLIDVEADNWGGAGIHMQFVDGFDISAKVNDIFYAGIMGLSAQNGIIQPETVVTNITGTGIGGVYGIEFSRVENDSLITHPKSKNINVFARLVDNVPDWVGIGTHGADNVVFAGTTVKNCRVGVDIVGSDNSSQVTTWGSLNVHLKNITVESGKTDGTAGIGIAFSGAGSPSSTIEASTGTISDCIITDHGDQSNTLSGGLYLRNTKNLSISGLIINTPSPSGINIYYQNEGLKINGVTIDDAWTNSGSVARGIAITDVNNTGYIGGSVFKTSSKTATHVMDASIRAENNTPNTFILGENYVKSGLVYTVDQVSGKPTFKNGKESQSKTYDPPSIASGAVTSTTITTFINASIGDYAQASFSVTLPAGVFMQAAITATNVATVTIVNSSGAPVDLASGTLKVLVTKQ